MVALPNKIKVQTYNFQPGKPAPEIPVPANDNHARGKLIFMGEDREYVPRPELVRDTMPRTGVGFIGGQSGSWKTFFSIHSATCFMTGESLAGRDIERTGGVVYLAAEGEGTIEGRLKARRTRLEKPDEDLPFYLLTGLGAVSDAAGYKALEAKLKSAADDMRKRFNVQLVALIVDTVAAAGFIAEDKENDPGAWQKVFDGLQPISKELDCVIILVHHAGKNASAGLRGSSNARAGADFALMLACDRDEITGLTANHYLHLAKSRDAPEGPIAAIHAEAVPIGSREDGSPITTLVLDFDSKAPVPAKKARLTKTDGPFRDAIDTALAERGETVRVRGEHDAPEIMAVRVDLARTEFSARYVTAQDDPMKRADAVRKQFNRALEKALNSGKYASGAWGGREWIWKL
jgi:AAA domain